HGRVVEAGARHQRTDFHSPRHGGNRRDQRPRLPWAARRAIGEAVEQVVANPDRIEAHRLGGLGHAAQLTPAHLALDLRELDPDFQWPWHAVDAPPQATRLVFLET